MKFWDDEKSITLTRCVVVAALIGSIAMTLGGPWVTAWFIAAAGLRPSTGLTATLLVLGYACAALAIGMLVSLYKFLRRIEKGEVFVPENVAALRRISWCCAGAAVLPCAPNNLHNLRLDENATGDQAAFDQRTRNLIQNFGSMEGYLQSPANVWDKLPQLIQEGNLPRLYFCCGTEDFLYPSYTAFKAYAQEIGLPATFEEEAGYTHEWAFWDLFIQKALDFFEI